MTTARAVARPAARPLRRPAGPLRSALLRVLRQPAGVTGLAILGVLGLLAIGAPLIAPHSPLIQHPGQELARPGGSFLLGTDELGRDLLSRILHGGRTSFLVAALAVSVGAVAGCLTGIISGYVGGAVDTAIMRTYDVILAFPGVLIGIATVTVLGAGTMNVAWALAIGLTPGVARLVRSSVLREREMDYVLAARSSGARPRRIMWLHIFPNTLPVLLVQLSLALGFTVLADASLSFLGLGTQPPDPSWGSMLSDSRAYLRDAPWYGFWPGVALALLVFGLNSLADATRDALDPRRVGL